jgi:hypothetical protein
MTKRKAKKKASRKTSTSRRTTLHTIQINLNREHLAYVGEIAEYACVTVDVVCAVMMATGIFQAKRYRVPVNEELGTLRVQLARCRSVMEANDPGNARDIFGEPQPSPAPATPPEGAPTVP